MAELDMFTDGLWHSVRVDIESGGDNRIGKVNITVDGRPDTANRQLTFTTTVDYYIGGKALRQALNYFENIRPYRKSNLN